MHARTIEALADALHPVIQKVFQSAVAPIMARLKVLEDREAVKGEKGDPGQDGAPGPAGEAGPAGERGLPGEIGEKGLDGKDGPPGPAGQPGERGLPGENGLDGKDGRDGQPGGPGSPGRDGLDGKDGAPGLNGKDGLGFDDLSVEHDGERGFTLRFVRGEQVREFPFTIPAVLDRGVWREKTWAKGDGVTWGGSFWIAQKDTATKPDTPNSDWRLAVKRGRDGKAGENGKAGPVGPKGEPGRNGASF